MTRNPFTAFRKSVTRNLFMKRIHYIEIEIYISGLSAGGILLGVNVDLNVYFHRLQRPLESPSSNVERPKNGDNNAHVG